MKIKIVLKLDEIRRLQSLAETAEDYDLAAKLQSRLTAAQIRKENRHGKDRSGI